jgi:hypothetical protein
MNQCPDPANLPVKAHFKLTADEMIRGIKAHSQHTPSMFRFARYLGGVMIFCAFFEWYKQDLMTALPLFLIGVFLISINAITQSGIRRRFRKNPNRDSDVSWTFTSEKISSEGDGFDHSMAWKKVFKFVDSSQGFLIYPQKELLYWIPFTGFESQSDIERVREIAKAQAVNYKRVK